MGVHFIFNLPKKHLFLVGPYKNVVRVGACTWDCVWVNGCVAEACYLKYLKHVCKCGQIRWVEIPLTDLWLPWRCNWCMQSIYTLWMKNLGRCHKLQSVILVQIRLKCMHLICLFLNLVQSVVGILQKTSQSDLLSLYSSFAEEAHSFQSRRSLQQLLKLIGRLYRV